VRGLVGLVLCAMGCGDNMVPRAPFELGGCDGLVIPAEPALAIHVDAATPITWSTNPPANGPHYGAWAAWNRSYPQLDRGNYVHNAEHGGVVLLYNCPSGCPAIVDSLIGVMRGLGTDPKCRAPVYNRTLIAPDPLLPEGITVAAVAWGYAYTASCFDPAIAEFASAHYAEAPEDLCGDGVPKEGTFIDP
jgi:hypothetical protein